MERAYEIITTEDLKIFSGVPSNEVVARHVHKIIQVVADRPSTDAAASNADDRMEDDTVVIVEALVDLSPSNLA